MEIPVLVTSGVRASEKRVSSFYLSLSLSPPLPPPPLPSPQRPHYYHHRLFEYSSNSHFLLFLLLMLIQFWSFKGFFAPNGAFLRRGLG